MTEEKKYKLTCNKAKCAKCGDIIESKHRHDYKECSCHSIMVDGGLDYIRRGGKPEDIIELSEYFQIN